MAQCEALVYQTRRCMRPAGYRLLVGPEPITRFDAQICDKHFERTVGHVLGIGVDNRGPVKRVEVRASGA
jgi:hypothetical protein